MKHVDTCLPGTPRSIFHTPDDTRQFLHNPLFLNLLVCLLHPDNPHKI